MRQNFALFGLLDDQVRFLKGWFKDTLPDAPIDQLAILRLDADMYQSTIEGLRYLYPKLSPGGYVILSVHGRNCHDCLDEAERVELLDNGLLFKVIQTGPWRPDGLPNFYQATFHTKEYIEREWSDGFQIVRYVERGIADNQDAVVLRALS